MGFLLTLLISIVFGVLGAVRPRVAAYFILAVFVLFDELGPGFTTFRGSFVFNAIFVGFYGIRLIEVITISAYIPILMLSQDRGVAAKPFATDRLIAFLFAAWIAVLMATEFAISGKATVSDWRLILTGGMQFHMLVLLFRNEQDVSRLVRAFLILLVCKAIYGLGMYAAGYGTLTPRGKLPFFWDSRQVEAFGLGIVILTAYLLNYNSVELKHRVISFFWASLMWLAMAFAVAGSIRRTVWVTTLLGMLGVLALSRRTTVLHYYVVIAVASFAVAAVLLLPGLDDFRQHMGRYVESMNFFDEQQRLSNIENKVHIDNVIQYFKMVWENPDILGLGVHGPSGIQYYATLMRRYSGEFPLGLAHNGPLRTVLFFGIVGLVLYFVFYFAVMGRTWRVFWTAPEDHGMKHVALASGVYLVLDFASALTLVPPFWTSSKGLFYTFFAAFVLGAVVRDIARGPRATSTEAMRYASADGSLGSWR